MANYVVLTEQEAQEAVKNICDWVEVQCCNLLDSTATPTEYATAFGYFTVALNAGGVRVAKFRPDLKTVDYDVCVHFEGYSSLQRLTAAALRIRPMLLEAEAYTRYIEATSEGHNNTLALLNKCFSH